MKKMLTYIAALLLVSASAQQQSKSITLEDIWQKGTFRAQYSPGFQSLKDGEHYHGH